MRTVGTLLGLLVIASCSDLGQESQRAAIDIPDGWRCSRDAYQDGTCTCGCGVIDLDCSANDRNLCRDNGCYDRRDLEFTGGVPTAADPRLCAANECGDGYAEFDERCDDGNATDEGGCSADCQSVTSGWWCEDRGPEGCRQVVCGDGRVEWGFAGASESCDDGNVQPGDGCGADCETEEGWYCPLVEGDDGVHHSDPCHQTVCSDGEVEGLEDCDDGNDDSGDGCSDACAIEPGWKCYSPGDPCVRAICSDGEVDEPNETCDDRNLEPLDGCDASCRLERCEGDVCEAIPAAWTCDLWRWGDGDCDCGCGILDTLDCEADAVAADCENDHCDASVDPANLATCLPYHPDCSAIYFCVLDCAEEDAACEADCREGADATSLAADTAMWQCSDDECGDIDRDDEDEQGYRALIGCHDRQCPAQSHACVFDRFRFTTKHCLDAQDCLVDCPSGQDCTAFCRADLSERSAQLLDREETCRAANCAGIDPNDSDEDGRNRLSTCLWEHCEPELSDCLHDGDA